MTADPNTPGENAKKMAKGFEGAVALTQNSTGHGSIGIRSNCTEGYIRKYFQSGQLPPVNTTCDADEQAFVDIPARLPKLLLWIAPPSRLEPSHELRGNVIDSARCTVRYARMIE